MDYHKNARLTVHSREHLARKVLHEGCTLKAAAASLQREPENRRQVGGPLSATGAAQGWWTVARDLINSAVHCPTWFSLVERPFAFAPPALDRFPYRRANHVPEPRHGQPHSAQTRHQSHPRPRSQAGLSSVMSTPLPAICCTWISRNWAAFAVASHRVTGNRGDTVTRGIGWDFVHVAVDDHSRIAFSAIYPDETKDHPWKPFCTQALAYYARARHSLQGACSPTMVPAYHSLLLCRGLSPAGAEASLHQALHTTHQRQGRALHSDRSARMGLCPRLSELRTTHPGTALLGACLQLAPASWLALGHGSAHQPFRYRTEQPIEP